MLKADYSNQFKKDIKLMQKRNMNMELLKEVISLLCNEVPLPPKYKDHQLNGFLEICTYKMIGF